MPSWMETLLALLALPQYGLSTLFVTAFTSTPAKLPRRTSVGVRLICTSFTASIGTRRPPVAPPGVSRRTLLRGGAGAAFAVASVAVLPLFGTPDRKEDPSKCTTRDRSASDPRLIVSAGTTVRDCEGLIATPGAIDVHVHFDSAGLPDHAIASGVTTLLGGSLGPITVGIDSGGPFNTGRMLQAAEAWPVNFGFLGRGNTHRPAALKEQLETGVLGLKIHEDWGAMPAAIDACLGFADAYDFQVQLHTDTLNESGFVEDTLAAIGGRTIHMYHTEGAGGGHAPDIIRVAGLPHCLPSSTNPTNPYTVNTFDEHLDMTMVCHHLNPALPEDVAFAESRIRAQTIAAEDVLHDIGAIAMLGSRARPPDRPPARRRPRAPPARGP